MAGKHQREDENMRPSNAVLMEEESANAQKRPRTTTTTTATKTIKTTLSQHRKQRQKLAQQREKEQQEEGKLKVVVPDFFEVEKVIGCRKRKGRNEFLIRWKGLGPTGDTWEPAAHLCDSAYRDAQEFLRKDKARKEQLAQAERLLGLSSNTVCGDKVIDLTLTQEAIEELAQKKEHEKEESAAAEKHAMEQKKQQDALDPERPTNSIEFQEIERIDVNDADSRQRVTYARVHGVPIVLTGHHGWTQFAAKWLKGVEDLERPLDLTIPWELNIEQMIDDIGNESVPILRKNYDETNPIKQNATAQTFLRKCWPAGDQPAANKNLYLHQWQFPRSETAMAKLCGPGKCLPLPNEIFEEDLLQHWLDHKQNPYQYLFMGDKATMSKLHKDPGGLEITIAPIVGEKECMLAHRLDGDRCLYDLNVKLEQPDLDKYPMATFARVWKSVIRPGEILVMPSNTYHQCRNLSPCLSYHRFHLDSINLRPFIESFLAGDALETDHDELVWNVATEMTDRVDKYVEHVKAEGLESQEALAEIQKTIDTLRLLRAACNEIAIQLHNAQHNRAPKKKINANIMKKAHDFHYWPRMVQDIDHSIHDFQYRLQEKPPRFRARKIKTRHEDDSSSSSDEDEDDSSHSKKGKGRKSSLPNHGAKSKLASEKKVLEKAIEKLPELMPFQEDLVLSDFVMLETGDRVFLRFRGRYAKGEISEIADQMKAVFVSYNELPDCFDEYQPLDSIKQQKDVPGAGESSSSNASEEQAGSMQQIVFCRAGGVGKVQPGLVKHKKCATFYLVKVELDNANFIKRWLTRSSIISKME